MRRRVYAAVWMCMVMCISLFAQAQPTANFTSNIVTGCAPILVQFTDQSSGSPTSWYWDLGNGTNSTLQNPSTTYISAGIYTITLTVTNASGSNTKVMTNYISVVPSPIVNFTGTDTFSCAPKTIQFTDLSTPGGTGTVNYLWDFGDGFTSNLKNPTHTYNSNGIYNVTLKVTNASGCSKILTKSNFIQLINKPTANFSATNNNSCTLPLSVTFTNASSGGVSYQWDFGNGTTSTATNPSCTYTSAGSYTVRLITTNVAGCSDTMIKVAFVNIGSLTAGFTKSTSTTCTNNSVSFTNTSIPGPGVSTWYFGDGTSFTGTNANHAYSTAGTFTVKLVVNYNNCSDSTTQTIVVNQGPLTAFSANNLVGCTVPFTTQFTNATTGASSYLWIFGDGTTSTATSPSHTYTAMGVYTVKLIAFGANGCNDTLTKTNYINITLPTISISANPATGCAPLSVSLSANIPSGVTITNYNWTFGDGNSGTGGPTILHTYTSGSYQATLTVTTNLGCTITSPPITITAGPPPTASFTFSPNPVCPNQTVYFTNTSTAPLGTIYQWTFGDGGTSTQVNPTYAYGGAGTYTITLTLNNNGCISTYTATIVVSLPKAYYTTNILCSDKLKVYFTDASIGANSYSWNFGDGATSTLQNPVHTYPTYGNYNCVLTVTNNATGCTSSKIWTISLFDVPALFMANDSIICKGQTVTFTSQSAPSANINSYIWDFGDGSALQTTTTNTVSHAYVTNGNFTVTLYVVDTRGCTDTLIKTNYIQVNGPTANFSGAPLSGCAPLLVGFIDQSSSGGSGIFARTWRFGDGSISTANIANVTHTYGKGTFNVTLVVTNGNGCKDSMVKANYVTATKPIAGFTANNTTICPGQSVTFTNSSVGSNLSYSWAFGDGGTSTATSPSHSYAATGSYTVTLIVTDGTMCIDTLIKTAYITVGGINLGFTASDTFATCPPLTVNFTNTSTNASNYTWIFGNGNASSLASPSTIYTLPGIYIVKLKGVNGGCQDSVSKTITILGPTGTFSYAPINGCVPLTVSFTATTQNTQILIWDMNNGVTQTTSTNTTTYTYTSPGKYIPKLLLSDGNSCIVPIQGPDTIKVDKVTADFSFSPNNQCGSGLINFIDTILYQVNPIATRFWTFGDGGTATTHNPSHSYAAAGTYTVKLVVTSTQGCKDSVVKTVTILPKPIVSAGNNVSICQGNTIPVQLQATGAVSYVWTPSSGLSCTNCANPLANPTVTTTYKVTGTGANGCSDTSLVTITVNPLPTIQTGPNPTICAGGSIQLAVAGATTYSWTPSTGLSCNNCNNPTASPATTTTYTITGTSSVGCSNTAQITVNVSAIPNVTATATKNAICVGDSSKLQALGGGNYSWSPAIGLSCVNCANPTANPTTTTTYIVSGSNSAGCTDTGMVTIVVNPLPVLSVPNKSVCIGSSVLLQASGANTYAWTPSTGLSCNNCANPTATISNTTTYSITGTSAAGCVSNTQMTITVNPLPVITANPNQTACNGTPVQLTASGGQTYVWSPSTGLSCTNCTSPTATPASTTTYTVVGKDANGCVDTARTKVSINPLPNVNAGPDRSICKLNSTQLQATGANTYVWSPSTGLSCVNCANPIASPTVATNYVVTGTDGNNCSKSDTVLVGIFPQPVVSAGADKRICFGTTTQLQATGAMTYIWSPSYALSCIPCPNPIAKPSNDITYTVVGTDANGCVDSGKVKISVTQLKPITIGKNDSVCQGESAQLTASGGDSYRWSPGATLNDSTSASPIASPVVTTSYTVMIKQGDCFGDTGKVTVVVNPVPTINAGPDQHIIAGSWVQLSTKATHTDFYLWTPATDLNCFDCSAPIATPKETITYKVKATNKYGCTASDDVTIYVTCDNSQIFLANTFTPNGDGNNDLFYPQGKGINVVQRFRIYSRWGELLYEAQNIQLNDETKGWDGTFKGEQLKPDVYVYILDAVCYNGSPMQIKGDISLIR